jgi:putative lipase involved disintegration of autophagic bodies
MSLTSGDAAFAFEAPGDYLYARRVGFEIGPPDGPYRPLPNNTDDGGDDDGEDNDIPEPPSDPWDIPSSTGPKLVSFDLLQTPERTGIVYQTRKGSHGRMTSAKVQAERRSKAISDGFSLSHLPIYHFGNNADPIFMGQCNGRSSSCYYGGYALETKCHLGRRCVYEIENSSLDVRFHRIDTVIGKVILPRPDVAECVPVKYGGDDGCWDCDRWQFV